MANVFGLDLEATNHLDGVEEDGLVVPGVIIDIVNCLKSYGKYSPELLASQGLLQTIQQLQNQYNKGEEPDLSKVHISDVVGLLHSFLLKLPRPIISSSLDDTIRSITKAHLLSGRHNKNPESGVISALHTSLHSFLPAEYCLFHYLVLLFAEINQTIPSSNGKRIGRNWIASAMIPSLTQSEKRKIDVLPHIVYLELMIDNVYNILEFSEEETIQLKRVSVNFKTQLKTKVSSFFDGVIEIQVSEPMSKLSIEDIRSPTSPIRQESKPPILTLIPVNGQFEQITIPLTTPILLCRTRKKNKTPQTNVRLVTFDNKCISRDHAEISWTEDLQKVQIKDLGSSCGTFVNGKKLTENLFFSLKNNDSIVLGENIPENDEGYHRVYLDNEVPPQNRCIRFTIEILTDSFPSVRKRSIPGRQKDPSVVSELISEKLMNALSVIEDTPRIQFKIFISRNQTKQSFVEQIEIFSNDRHTHHVDLSVWRSKRTLTLHKLPNFQHGLSIIEPLVIVGTKIHDPIKFFQISRDGNVVCLFDRVSEGIHHSLEFQNGTELVLSGDLKAYQYNFWGMNDEKSIGEVFGKEIESINTESFLFELSKEFESQVDIFLTSIVLATL